jgi:hypothetical protein
MHSAADADVRKVKLRTGFVEEVFPVTAVKQHPRLSDSLQPGAIVWGEKRRNAHRIRGKRRRIERGVNPDSRKGTKGGSSRGERQG